MNRDQAKNPQSKLYWDGGDFLVSIFFVNDSWDDNRKNSAASTLEKFRQMCKRHYFAYTHASLGLRELYTRYEIFFADSPQNSMMWIGSKDPNDPKEMRGNSTIGCMPQTELLSCLQKDGEFQDLLAKSFIVSIYHVWDDAYRAEIANTLSISKNDVECPLMGDLRLVRNLIVHKGSVVPPEFSNRLDFLPEIWNFPPGNLAISDRMIDSLMEQLNAIHVIIASPEPST